MEIEKKVKIANRLGFHLRAAAQFVKTSCKFRDCRVLVKSSRGSIDGKSLLNLITLAASYGSELTLVLRMPGMPARPFNIFFSTNSARKINKT